MTLPAELLAERFTRRYAGRSPAFKAGYEAWSPALSECGTNPYPHRTAEHTDWLDGFLWASYDYDQDHGGRNA